MKIGIIGAGNIGGTVARLLTQAGHAVAISNSRGPESLLELVTDIGPGAQALSVEDAARWAEVVLLATPWRRPEALPSAEAVRGKIVIDAMNQYGDSGLLDLGDATASEQTAERLPGARLVKAFNTLYFKTLQTGGQPGGREDERLTLFVAGDDEDAKAAVSRLIEEIGFSAVDTGSLREGGRRQEPSAPVFNKPMTATEARAALGRTNSG